MKILVHKMRGYFLQFFSYFSIVVLLTAFLLGGALYLYFSRVLEKETVQTNNNILNQIKNAEEFILSEVNKSFANMLLDPFFMEFMNYYRKNDMVLLMSIKDKLQNVVVSNEYLDSAYIYYMEDKAILSSNLGFTMMDDFSDRAFIDSLTAKGTIPYNYVVTRTIKDSFNKNNIKVLSFVKRIPTNPMNSNVILVVINVKAEYLQNAINAVKLRSNSALVIMSGSEQIISTITNRAFPSAMELYSNNRITGIKASGSYQDTLYGVRSLVSVVYSEKHQWWYVYIVPLSVVTESIRLLGIITIFFCFAVITLGIIWSFIFSKKLYSPISTAFSLFSDTRTGLEENPPDVKAKANELDMIQNNIRKLINRNRSLEKMLEEYNVYQKNEFLKGLLKKDEAALNKTDERLKYYNIPLERNGGFMALVISMDNYEEFTNMYSEKQRNALKMYIRETASDEVPPELYGFTAEMDANEIVIILNIRNEETAEEAAARCYELARQIQRSASENKKQTFSLGVSRLHKGFEKIPDCYAEASNALNYRFLQGVNQTILYENVGLEEKSAVIYPYNIEKKLLNSLKLRNREEVLNYLDDFADCFYNSISDNAALVRTCFLQLLTASVRCISETGLAEGAFILEDGGSIYSRILSEQTMKGLVGQMESFYTKILKQSEVQYSIKNDKLVSLILKYVEDHISDDLSIERLAEEFYISPSYIRKIFKEKTNTTIKGYTNELRMNKAKMLLEDPHIRISQIAAQVGYLSVQSFTTVFKLNTGKTPREYRLSAVENSKDIKL